MKNKRGITLIALIITVIIMLILAGISLNAILGDNGVLNNAKQANKKTNAESNLEKMNIELTAMNIDTMGNDNGTPGIEALNKLEEKGLINSYLANTQEFKEFSDDGDIEDIYVVPIINEDGSYEGKTRYVVKKDEFSYEIYQNSQGVYNAVLSDIDLENSGGDVTGGTILVTEKSFTKHDDDAATANEQGQYTISGDATLIFVDEISGVFSIYVKSGNTANVSVFNDLTLTNSGLKRSAIELETGATLNLWVANGAEVTVNSGFGEDGVANTPGKGGYAGIHVPTGAELNLKGKGTVVAYGGNAGNGGAKEDVASKGAGGGGAGAGIGGEGGEGGQMKTGVGDSGKAGGNCGIVNIYNSVTVYAYGGAGGSGGTGVTSNADATGAGGYPGAGIGGGGAGGAGGTCCAGGGGYSGGTAEFVSYTAVNGLCGGQKDIATTAQYCGWGGNGYFLSCPGICITGTCTSGHVYTEVIDRSAVCFGGFSSWGAYGYPHTSGTGGIAGSGGTIRVSPDANVYAYNGNRYTDGTPYNNGQNQCPIYAQDGIKIAKYKYDSPYCKTRERHSGDAYFLALDEPQEEIAKSGYQNTQVSGTLTMNSVLSNVDMSYQGVGSGAGYTEVSNGTYSIDSSLQ